METKPIPNPDTEIGTSNAENGNVADFLSPDRKSSVKKVFAILAVGGLAVVALGSFVVFGKLLSEYIEFTEAKTYARQELKELEERVQNERKLLRGVKEELQADSEKLRAERQTHAEKSRETEIQFDKRIAEREGKIRGQQTLIDKHTALLTQIAEAEKARNLALAEQKKVQANLAIEIGTEANLRKYIETLESRKTEIENILANLAKKKAVAEEENAAIAVQISQNQKAASEVKTEFIKVQGEIAAEKAKLAEAKNEAQKAAEELRAARSLHVATHSAVTVAKGELENLSSRKAEREMSLKKLEEQITKQEENLAKITGEIANLAKKKTAAEEENAAIAVQISQSQKAASEVKTEFVKVQGEIAAEKAKFAEAKKEAQKAEEELRAARSLHVATHSAVTVAKGELESLVSRKGERETSLKKLEEQIAKQEENLAKITGEIANLAKKKILVEEENAAIAAQISQNQKAASEAKIGLTKLQSEIAAEIENLMRKKNEVKLECDGVQEKLEKVKMEYSTLGGRLGALQETIRIREEEKRNREIETVAMEKRWKTASDGAKYWEKKLAELKGIAEQKQKKSKEEKPKIVGSETPKRAGKPTSETTKQ